MKLAIAKSPKTRCRNPHRREQIATPPCVLAAKAVARRARIDWSMQPLGQMPDADLAKVLGISIKTVSSARFARGIACFGKSTD